MICADGLIFIACLDTGPLKVSDTYGQSMKRKLDQIDVLGRQQTVDASTCYLYCSTRYVEYDSTVILDHFIPDLVNTFGSCIKYSHKSD
jgi:hypothetical protein